MRKKWVKSFSVALCGLTAGIFYCAVGPSTASAQTKAQLRAQYKETATKLRSIAWSTACAPDIASLCKGVKPGSARIYNCVIRNKSKLSSKCSKKLPEAKALVNQLTKIRAQITATQAQAPMGEPGRGSGKCSPSAFMRQISKFA